MDVLDINNEAYFMVNFNLVEDREKNIKGRPKMIFVYYFIVRPRTSNLVILKVKSNNTLVKI
uniref:Uncharacterized protein n=1 Tax=Cajanus cajan TaxID=3821 RepID=A0A151RQF0_CAJCA|nr:hypothetical protein KK1_033741 [Cajanus cajan]